MEKKLYGGDAEKINQLDLGDIMNIDLLDRAIRELISEAYISKRRINVLLTDDQLDQIRPKRDELTAMIYFLPIRTYKSDKKIQEAIVTCNNKTIKIYTYKD